MSVLTVLAALSFSLVLALLLCDALRGSDY